MNRWLLLVIAFVGLNLLGCSHNNSSGGKPPKLLIDIDSKAYEALLGTYCWGNTCVDTIGPVEMLKDKEPIQVKPGETISFIMKYEPLSNEIYVTQIHDGEEKAITVQDGQFTVPAEEGTYHYVYSVWWLDERGEDLSHGDAFYAFALEVVL